MAQLDDESLKIVFMNLKDLIKVLENDIRISAEILSDKNWGKVKDYNDIITPRAKMRKEVKESIRTLQFLKVVIVERSEIEP